MRKYQISSGLFIALMILLTGFKKNSEWQTIISDRSTGINYHDGNFKDPIKISIAGTTAIQGDKGQRPVKVMVYLSHAATEPVTVNYNTVNGSAKAGVDYVAASGSVTFQKGEAAKWITVFIIGKVAADPDEDAPVDKVADFMINISHAVGVIIDVATAYISIIQNFVPNNPAVGARLAVYEVMISYNGFLTFADSTDCPINKNGVVVLSGYLSGPENTGPGDDITYRGTLEMIIDIDICSINPGAGPHGEDEMCSITVDGSGKVFTELKLKYGSDEESRGGYIKIENKDGGFIKQVTGSCKEQEKDEELTMIPDKSIASVFNGYELSMLTSRTLRTGTFTDTGKFGNTVVQVLRKIQ